MNLMPIAIYLGLNACGEIGKSIFITEMPNSCDQGILLMEAYSGTPIDHYLPGYFQSEFRVIIRSVDFEMGKALGKVVSGLLTSHGGFVAGSMQVTQCLPLNLPRPYRRSVGGYWEFEIDMEITFVDLTA